MGEGYEGRDFQISGVSMCRMEMGEKIITDGGNSMGKSTEVEGWPDGSAG